jgi:hypothetical protein
VPRSLSSVAWPGVVLHARTAASARCARFMGVPLPSQRARRSGSNRFQRLLTVDRLSANDHENQHAPPKRVPR